MWSETLPADATGAVDVVGWWKAIEDKMIEAAVYYTATPIHLEADKIAPWIPPACRGKVVLNTEHLKGMHPHVEYLSTKHIIDEHNNYCGCTNTIKTAQRRDLESAKHVSQ